MSSIIGLLLLLVITICSMLGGASMFWLAFVICAGILVVRNYISSGKYQGIYILLLFAHVGALLYQMTGHALPMSGGDWGVFVRRANTMLANAERTLDIFNVFSNKLSGDLYERLCAYIYYVFGYNQKYMYTVSFICGEIVYYNMFKISSLIENEEETGNAIIASIVFYATPIEIVYSVDFLREMLVQAFVIVACYSFFLYIKNKSITRLGVALILSIVASLIHSGYVGVLIAFVACFFLMDRKQDRLNVSLIRIIIVFIVVFAIYVSPIWSIIATRLSGVDSLADLADISSNQYAGLGNTTYIGAPRSVLGVILQTPLRFFYYLVSPLPWQVRSMSTIIAMLLDSTFRWVVFYRIIKMLFHRDYHIRMGERNFVLFQSSVIIIAVITLIFCWGTSNYGTAMRHRTSMYPIELILISVIWEKTQLTVPNSSNNEKPTDRYNIR